MKPSQKALLISLIGLINVFSRTGSAQSGRSALLANMFAARACATVDAEFCPGGVWNQAAFDAMYLDPSSNPGHYPPGGPGLFTRREVPLCETGDCGLNTIRCTDGTRPVYYYKPGVGAGADKWIIKIQHGGDTCSSTNCFSRYANTDRDDFSSAYGLNWEFRDPDGIFNTDPANLFHDYNLVVLDKCVGDRNLGDTTIPNYDFGAGNLGPVFFHGYRIILALLQALKDQSGANPDLQDAALIAFTTQSNGSNGAYMYMDRLHQYVLDQIAVPGNTPDVRLLASSYLLPNPEVEYALENGSRPASYPEAYGHVNPTNTNVMICGNGFDAGNPLYQDWMDAGMKPPNYSFCVHGVGFDHLRGIGGMFFSTADFEFGRQADLLATWGAIDGTPTIDASCRAAHQGTGDLEACNDSTHVLLYHLTTPTFFAAQMGDHNLRTTRLASLTITFDPAYCDIGDTNCHDENYRGDTNGAGDPIPSEAGWQKEDFQVRIEAIVTELFNGQSPHREQPEGLGHGAFIDNSIDHLGWTSMNKLRRPMMTVPATTPFELQEYLRQWLDPNNNLLVVCVDEGPLYDTEFAPPVALPDAPPGLVCDSGFYFDPGTPVAPEQVCNDPFANVASPAFACQAPPPSDYTVYLPIVMNP